MADKDENLENETNTETTSVADVFINQIIVQLHEKALEQVKEKDYTIQNSAIEGEGKKAKFYGAGQHIVAAIPTKVGEKIPINVAFSMLKTYVQWFVGPDLKKSIEEKDLIELESDGSGTAKKDNKDSTDKSKKTNDSAIYVPSFSQYLLTEEGELDDKKAEKQHDDNVDAEQKKKEEDVKKNAEDESKQKSAPGYYITYKMEIEGQKEHPLADALKKFATNLIDGFGVKFGSWKTGASGEAHTIGDLKNALSEVFGSIDPDKLQQAYQKNLQQDFKQTHAQASIFDTKTIVNMLKNQLSGSDRQKIKSAEYALCTRVSRNDKSYELFNQTKIANTITKSIQGLFKKFKNKLTNKDVILVNNYDDNEKNSSDNKFKAKKKEEVEDSLISASGNLILEENDDKEKQKSYEPLKQDEVEKTLQGIAKSQLKENFVEARARDVKTIVDILKKSKVTDPELISMLNKDIEKYPNAYLIQTSEDDVSKKKVNASQHTNYLLDKLFESISKSNLQDKVKGTFITLFDALAKKQNRDSSDKLAELPDIKGYSPDNESPKKESKETNYKLFKLCFEDIDAAQMEQLFEAKTGGKVSVDRIIDFIKQKGAENILNTKDKYKDALDKVYSDEKFKATYLKGKTDMYKKNVLSSLDKIYAADSDDSMIEATNKTLEEYKNGNGKGSAIILKAIYEVLDSLNIEDKKDEEKVTVTFYDYDPEKDQKIEEPLDKLEIEKGTAINASEEGASKFEELDKKLEDGKKKGFTFKGWDPVASTKVEEDTDVVAKYVKDEDKDKEFTVVFQYPPDPSKADNVKQIEGDLGEQKIKAGEAAQEPEKPEIEGWNFKKWSDSFDNITEDKLILAEYAKKINIIPMAPKDPEKPDDTEPVGEPIPYDPTIPIKDKLPELPEKKGWKAKGWNPDPETIKDPTEDIEIVGEYEKEDSDKGITITFKEPKKPDDPSKLVTLGEPIKFDPDKRITPPKPTDFTKAGYKFDKWNPDPDSIEDPKEDVEIVAQYKKTAEAGKITTYWILQDINNFLGGQKKEDNELKTKRTGLDFYIAPMKGLKYKDDDLERNQKK